MKRKAKPMDSGSVTLFTIVFFFAVLVAVGLVVDGGAKLRAAREASAIAEEAARAGAGQVNRDHAYAQGGTFTIDQNTALQAARAYLAASGNTGTVSPLGSNKIQITVTVSKPAPLLSLIGIGRVDATETATADLVEGVSAPGR